MQQPATIDAVLGFWKASGYDAWFNRDDAFDEECRGRFLGTHEAAARGELAEWEASPDGALALVLLLDQFPRNLFRGTPRVYATDPAARAVAARAVARGDQRKVDPALSLFFVMPFMHSEDLADQDRCVSLCEAWPLERELPYALGHRDIVARFGRFPHRNPILGRATTAEEQAYLDEGGFTG